MKKPPQKQRILQALREAGDKGVLNRDLNEIAFRYSARIGELRKAGYEISEERVSDGLHLYKLLGELSPEQDAQGAGRVTRPDADPSVAPPVAEGSAQLFDLGDARRKPASPYDVEAA